MVSKNQQWLLQEKYNGNTSPEFYADCKRLEAGEPLAYLIGHVPFLDCTIYLDSRPLIPRPETEWWTAQALTEIQASATSLRILDLCAGSGCIGVAIAKSAPHTKIDFADIDTRHLPTIIKNLQCNDITENRYHVFPSDLFANVSGQYDFILTNPPYIDPALDRTEPAVKRFEPHHALYGGIDGTEFIIHILESAPQFLNSKGQIWIEHEPEHAELIHARSTAQYATCKTHNDQYEIPRYSVLTVA